MRGLALWLLLLLIAVPLAGCIGTDPDPSDPGAPGTPAPSTDALLPETITGLAELGVLEMEGSGTGIWIDEARELLYSANGGGGVAIVDISDPAQPERLSLVDDLYARDVDMLVLDERVLVVAAGGAEGLHVIDATDPREPELLATASEYSVHNVAAVPGTPYIYDATAVGAQAKVTDPVIPVLDVSNPTAPVWETIPIPTTVNGVPVQSDGCHDVVVRTNLGMAYCAGGGGWYMQGGGETFLWDISQDPLAPEWIGVIDNPSIVYHHQALASHDGRYLYINDEYIQANCNSLEEETGLPIKQTTAAMWVYDITDPANPQLMSWVQPDVGTVSPSNCGSHFGDLIDDRDVLTWGWYMGGTLLIDVSDPAEPVILDRKEPIGATWDARYHAGHVYGSSGDLQVFDVV